MRDPQGRLEITGWDTERELEVLGCTNRVISRHLSKYCRHVVNTRAYLCSQVGEVWGNVNYIYPASELSSSSPSYSAETQYNSRRALSHHLFGCKTCRLCPVPTSQFWPCHPQRSQQTSSLITWEPFRDAKCQASPKPAASESSL